MKETLGDYQILDLIDPGGYTRVYRAVQDMGAGVSRPAAVKVLEGCRVDDDEQLEALRREVRVLADVGTSPNVVNIYGFGIDEDVGPWIAMELWGLNLKHYLRAEPADPEDVRAVLRDGLRGLSAVHGADPQILHRDLKPQNILSSSFGLWKLADFGLAKRDQSEDTINAMTVKYAAPELLDASLGPESPKMDLYSLGHVVYEFALGTTLHREQFPSVYDPYAKEGDGADDRPKWMYWHTSPQMSVTPLAELLDGFPQDLSDLIAAMTAKPSHERLASANDGLARVGEVVMPAFAGAGADEEGARGDGGALTKALLLLLTVVLVAVLAGVGWFGFRQATVHPEIALEGGGAFTAAEPRVLVTGSISDFPEGGAAQIRLRDGSAFPVAVDDDGSFAAEVRVRRLGPTDALLSVTDQASRERARKILTVERVAPERVDVVLRIRPAIANATVLVTERERPDAPSELTTDENGMARTSVAFGAFDYAISHPRFRRFGQTAETGFDPTKTLTVGLMPLSEERVDQKRETLLTEMDDLAEAAAAGDPDAASRLREIRDELALMEAVAGDKAAVERAALMEELDDVAGRAAAGDPDAAARLKEINEELRQLAAGEAARQVSGGAQQPASGGKMTRAERNEKRAKLINEMADLTRRSAAGDEAATARLRELQRQLRGLEADEPDGVIARRRADLLEEMARLAPLAAAGDPAAAARMQEIQRELAALAAIEAADGDASMLAASAGEMIGGIPAIDLIDRTTLMRLPPDLFKAFIEVNLPTGALTVERIPHMSRIRVRGPLFNEEEMERLVTRLAPAEPRLQLELRIDPWAVCRRLQANLEQRGARDARVHAHLGTGDQVMYVQCRPDPPLDHEALVDLAHSYVLDPDLIIVQDL